MKTPSSSSPTTSTSPKSPPSPGVTPLTDKACPRCLAVAEAGKIRPETIQRVPVGAWAPRAVPNEESAYSGPQCLDCGSADGLLRMKYGLPGWVAARIAVGNERQEQYRLPGVWMGLVACGVVRPSAPGDFEAHHAWLNANGWFELHDGTPCTLHDECKAYQEMGSRCAAHQERSTWLSANSSSPKK